MSELTGETKQKFHGWQPEARGVSRRSRLVAERFLSLLLFVGGIGVIAMVTLKPVLDHFNVSSKATLVGVAALALVLSAAFVTPFGRRVVDRWSIPHISTDQNIFKLLFLTAEFGVLVLLVRLFEIENAAFYDTVVLLAFGGFLVNHFMPKAYRMSFFLALSVLGFASVLGIVNAAWLIAIGLVLIGITRLRISFRLRVVLLLVAVAGLVLARVDIIPAPWSQLIWPILGSIFMFRLIVYLYDLKHAKSTPGVVETLSYFFLLPNIIFPLFPVVDFSAFRRTYYDGDQYEIYQRGLRWMLRGVVYLILYRFLYYYVAIAPADVQNAGDLVRYLLSNYPSMLRIFGQFDLIVGMLHLFGFNLPQTNYLNFFASSFTDFWRRSNIYWKDFMLKVVYYPSYFRLRILGGTLGLVLATLVVFVATWFLHAYQWFWILGNFPLTIQDALFWGSFGILMVINLLWEQRFGRKRAIKGASLNLLEFGGQAVKIIALFAFICVLWSLWTAASLAQWFTLWQAATVIPPFDPPTVAAGIIGGAIFLGIYVLAAVEWDQVRLGGIKQNFFVPAAMTGALILLVYVSGNPYVQDLFPERERTTFRSLEVDRLNTPDTNLLAQGYYENILGVSRANSQLWEVYMKRPLNAQEEDTRDTALYMQYTDDFLKEELRPRISITFHGAPFHTNQWGMRDRDYQLQKAPGTYRIVLLGGSYIMGTGVSDSQTFDNLVEDRLNQDDKGKPYNKYELLNFGTGGYSELQDLMLMETQAFKFQPDAVFLFANPRDGDFSIQHLEDRIQNGITIPYPGLQAIVQKAGVTKGMQPPQMEQRLTPFKPEIMAWTYQQIAADCKAHGVRCIWIYLTMPGSNAKEPDLLGLEGLAKQAGLFTINMTGVYDGVPVDSITLSNWDEHPNAKGHAIIAARLYQLLHTSSAWTALGLGSAATSQSLPAAGTTKK